MIRMRTEYVGCLLVLACSTVGQSQETLKYFESDIVSQGQLGFSVSLDGNTGFAGAPATPLIPGLGYVFNLSDGSTQHPLIPSVQSNSSMFGFTSQVSGNRLVVGDPTADRQLSGSAYVFDTVSGVELARLQPDDSFNGDEFGYDVDLFGKLAAIGAPHRGEGEGAAYLFDIDTGQQLHKLTPDVPVAGIEFGGDVAVSDDYALVGAVGDLNSTVNVDDRVPGITYVFDVKTGQQLFRLLPNDSSEGDEFGFDMAISGNLAVIGAPKGGSVSGAAYVYDLTTGSLVQKLSPDQHIDRADFGSFVDIEGNVVAVGANGLERVTGSVYLFDARTGAQLDKILPSDSDRRDTFGFSVALNGTQLLVGAPRDDPSDVVNQGAAYLFDLDPSLFSVLGDFNQDGALGVEDIDLLTLAVFNGSDSIEFDLDGDGSVGGEDREFWVNELFGTYLGDANLDGQFDSSDLVAMLIPGEYEDAIDDNSTWASGDFNGDLDFDTGDLVVALAQGGYEMGPRPAVTAVPEPASGTLMLIAIIGLARIARRR